jgi:hypothetical protein
MSNDITVVISSNLEIKTNIIGSGPIGETGDTGPQGIPGIDGTGGDMNTTTYDINANGVVDNAEKVNGYNVLKDVPVDALFTDTITSINNKTGAILKADITALGIPAQDTVYTHPTTHPASMITDLGVAIESYGVSSVVNQNTGENNIKIWSGTEADFQLLTPDADTLYIRT